MRVPRLNYINALWREGEIASQIVKSQVDVIEGFKLQRR